MDEMTLLQAMRSEIPTPDSQELAGTESRLLESMTALGTPARADGRSVGSSRSWWPRPLVRIALAGAVAAVAVASVGVGLVSRPAAVDHAVGSAGDTANLRLVAAAEATAQTSYRLKVSTSRPQRMWPTEVGAYDPVGPKGYLRSTSAAGIVSEFRIIGDDGYFGSNPKNGTPKFHHVSGVKGFPMLRGTGSGTDGGQTVDPTELLRVLKAPGSLKDLGRSGSGSGEVNTYLVSTEHTTRAGRMTQSTTVVVGVDSGKVSKVTFNTDVAGQHRFTMTLEFSDYGTKVDVERP
jgi:hypothetical protein